MFLLGYSVGGVFTAASVVEDASPISGVISTSPACPSPVPSVGRYVLGAAAALMPNMSLPIQRVPGAVLSSLSEQRRLVETDPEGEEAGTISARRSGPANSSDC